MQLQGSPMKHVKRNVATAISESKELVDMLDMILTESSDRAYVVCDETECRNNRKGKCVIHMIKGSRKLLADGRCIDYVT
jgi:hypothetical protein